MTSSQIIFVLPHSHNFRFESRTTTATKPCLPPTSNKIPHHSPSPLAKSTGSIICNTQFTTRHACNAWNMLSMANVHYPLYHMGSHDTGTSLHTCPLSTLFHSLGISIFTIFLPVLVQACTSLYKHWKFASFQWNQLCPNFDKHFHKNYFRKYTAWKKNLADANVYP